MVVLVKATSHSKGGFVKLTNTIIGQYRHEFNQFLQPYLQFMDQPRKKILPRLLEGILSSGSCLIAEAARSFKPACLFTLERQFLRTLVSPQWDESNLWVAHLREVGKQIQEHTLINVDISDLAKPYAQKLQALATVRDGSKKQLTKGYWMLSMTAALDNHRILPLAQEVFSQESDEFKSQNDILFFWMECLLIVTKGKGTFVIDRGGDGDPMFNFLLNHQAHFLIRINPNRTLLEENLPVPLTALPSQFNFNLRKTLKRHHPNVTFDWKKVRLPHRQDLLTLIFVRCRQDAQPILLLTNQAVGKLEEIALLIEAYFSRWEIEEAFRFLKQQFHLEKFLIRNFRAIQRLFFLLCIAWAFLTRFLRLKRAQKLLQSLSWPLPKKRINFFYYQWFRGLQFFLALLHLLRFLEVF